MNITHRQYDIEKDRRAIYDFMTEIYDPEWKNGAAAPFLEIAMDSPRMDSGYLYKNRIWMDGDSIVAFCFFEFLPEETFFSLRPGYEFLADEMVDYAFREMPDDEIDRHGLVLFAGQTALIDAAKRYGYTPGRTAERMVFNFENTLDHTLPEGFRFVTDEEIDVRKSFICYWKGMGHSSEDGSYEDMPDFERDIVEMLHYEHGPNVVIENSEGEYVCYSGMWWVPENKLAYNVILCTVPEFRKMGLASAAVSEHYRRMKALGATHMTGGVRDFYRHLGYNDSITWTYWYKTGKCSRV